MRSCRRACGQSQTGHREWGRASAQETPVGPVDREREFFSLGTGLALLGDPT